MARWVLALAALVALATGPSHAAPAPGSGLGVMVVNVGHHDGGIDVSVGRGVAAKADEKAGAADATAAAVPQWLVLCLGCTAPSVSAALAGHDPAALVAVGGAAPATPAAAARGRALLQAGFDNDFSVNPEFALGGKKGDDGTTIHGVSVHERKKPRKEYDRNWREKETKFRAGRKEFLSKHIPAIHGPMKDKRQDPVELLKEAADGSGSFAKIAQSLLETKGKSGSELAITSGFKYERTRKHFAHRMEKMAKHGIGSDLDRLSPEQRTGEAFWQREHDREAKQKEESLEAAMLKGSDGMRHRRHRRSLRERPPSPPAADGGRRFPAADVAAPGEGVVVSGVRPGEFVALGGGLLRAPELERALAAAAAGGGGGEGAARSLAEGLRSPRALRHLLEAGGVAVSEA